jgi:hypothetical protein
MANSRGPQSWILGFEPFLQCIHYSVGRVYEIEVITRIYAHGKSCCLFMSIANASICFLAWLEGHGWL